MTAIEVLAPIRIETRFVIREADGNQILQLRVYPDDFSIAHGNPDPTEDEVALLAAANELDVDSPAAFAMLASAVGAPRAVWLLRNVTEETPGAARPEWPDTSRPVGLPDELTVWITPVGGLPQLAATLLLNTDAIGADMDLKVLEGAEPDRLPETWWLSFARACDVGLGVEIDLGPIPPDIESLVVVGRGDSSARVLVDSHTAVGRLAVLTQGASTNTVHGEPTTDLGRDPEIWHHLVNADIADQPDSRSLVRALTGAELNAPIPGGEGEHRRFSTGLVAALWPALWGRTFRDVLGAQAIERELSEWAREFLAVEGPYPAMRIGDQPYGVLPTTALQDWVPDPTDPPIQAALVDFAQRWRDLAADAALTANPTVIGADTPRLLDIMGSHAPHRHWAARVVKPEPLATALNAAFNYAPPDTSAWVNASEATVGGGAANPVGTVWYPFGLPGGPADEEDSPRHLTQMLEAPSELPNLEGPLGLFGHLVRESLVIMRCLVGQAHVALLNNAPVDPDRPLPLLPPDTDPWQTNLLIYGSDFGVEQLRSSADPGAQIVAGRFEMWRDRLRDFLNTSWTDDRPRSFRALLATLDTSAFRVDPWLTGIADQRLMRMTGEGVPFLLGAYGWVDRPRPAAGIPGVLRPGPTAAGLLHAPSVTQAATAAVLRDAAMRHPGDPRWDIAVDSTKVRAAARLSERVRLGVHPHEALGLEVERLAGDWDTVRLLRKAFPLVGTDAQNRTVDGARALNAILRATEPVDPTLLGLAETLRPLDQVLDTYADLLIADGVHAMVSGQAEIASAAMDAAAGLGAPPELRSIRTTRSATEVRTTVLVVVEPSDLADDNADPRALADPAFTALVAEQAAGVPPGPARDAIATRLSILLGGGDEYAPDEPSLRAPIVADLDIRHQRVLNRLEALRAEIAAVSVDDLAAVTALQADASMWEIDTTEDEDVAAWVSDALAVIDDRLDRHGAPDATPTALRTAIRALIAAPNLPVLAIVPAAELPVMVDAPTPGDEDALDSEWLPLVAAVRPRLAALEAWQLNSTRAWPATIGEPGGSAKAWVSVGPVFVCFGPEPALHADGDVAVCVLDVWTDAVPQRSHTTAAAFGFNGPRSRAPQSVLLAVPPDSTQRLTNEGLLRVVLETRRTVRARLADGLNAPLAAPPSPILSTVAERGFTEGWR